MLSLESVDYFGTSEYFFSGRRKNVYGDKRGWRGKQQQANRHINIYLTLLNPDSLTLGRVVNFHCLQMKLVMSIWFIFGDNWNDAHPTSWSRFGFLAMCTIEFEPRYNEGPREWQNVLLLNPGEVKR